MNMDLLTVGFESHGARAASLRTSSMTEAAYRKARAESMAASKSFASRRFRLIQAKKRSTTQRGGLTPGQPTAAPAAQRGPAARDAANLKAENKTRPLSFCRRNWDGLTPGSAGG